MSKGGVLNVFAVMRSVGLALAITGGLFVLLAVLAGMQAGFGWIMLLLPFATVLGGIGVAMAMAGLAFVVIACLTRLFVSWTRFRTD